MSDAAAGTPAPPPPSPWQRERPARPHGTPARAPLSRERVVEAAFTVLDRQGFDGLSMRQVAAELGVAVSALYAHVSSKDDLLELMYTRLFDGYAMPAADPERWQEQLRDFARTWRRRLMSHRDMARISMGHVPFTAELLPHVEALLAVFRTAGLPDRIAAEAGDLISTYIDGFVLEEGMWQDRAAQQGGAASPARPDWHEMADEMRNYFASLPAQDFPHLRALSGLMVADTSDERFDIGLEIILRGLASYLPAPATDPAPEPDADPDTGNTAGNSAGTA
ncbi:TetR/AcrR family transcriptional regulator C-terminal domain-containing protein [Streptomyces monashensis]|uniref:TetR family transcriptional regulator n=1 Tax=Streptomyces monashensis TaxID=1678012 RepID=A0A1S2QHV9_9ACTN|nr:TetR/AcrR family transcriptional regulator C-terminal domain-containing protein [Streptomyces monashensis]OIK05253.1 TetR family transcriptional regulator [Streptomyces monashensis]